jgi:hypothetical protein
LLRDGRPAGTDPGAAPAFGFSVVPYGLRRAAATARIAASDASATVERTLTLVLTAATPKRVMQVSDRRMTYLKPNGTVHHYDDESNKAVLYCGAAAISYTGLGELEGQATDWWILEELADARSLSDVFHILRTRANEAFDPLRASWSRSALRHTFVVAGWGVFPPEDEVQPYITVISNFELDGETAPEAGDEFQETLMRPSGDAGLIVPAGEPLTEPEWNWVRNEFSAHLEHDRDTQDLAEILAGQVKFVAKRCSTVGRGLLITSLPFEGIRRNREAGFAGAYAQRLDDDHVTSFNMSPDDSTTTWEAPHLVCEGSVIAGRVSSMSREEIERRTAGWEKTRRRPRRS